ncbi:SufD family Fe-S cluster assembly protein [Culicoidibacter larvae]|nr:SufD family Fe-S cluster assembly protein [Culicoidibacter larvae]
MLPEHIQNIVGDAQSVLALDGDFVEVNTSNAGVLPLATFANYEKAVNQTQDTLKYYQKNENGAVIAITQSQSEPLNIVFSYDNDGPSQYVIEIADNVDVTIMEHHIMCDCGDVIEAATINIEILVGRNANVTYSAFDTSGIKLTMNRFAIVDGDAKLDFAAGLFGEDCVSETYVHLVAPGAEAYTKVMMYGHDHQKQLHKVRVNHFAPNTTSFITNHGVITGHATGLFEGIGFIEKGAHQSDAQQESRIMVMDKTARGDVHPVLLIDEYDVIAGHAGSVGRVSDETLYYLQSRGLSKLDAFHLVTAGFLMPVIEAVKDEQTRERIKAIIESKVK